MQQVCSAASKKRNLFVILSILGSQSCFNWID